MKLSEVLALQNKKKTEESKPRPKAQLFRKPSSADEEEGENMAKVLGDNRVLILRNHGALIAAPTVAQAYIDIYQFERACMYQLLAIAGGGKMQLIPEDIVKKMGQDSMNDRNVKHFEGMKRWLDEVKSSYMK